MCGEARWSGAPAGVSLPLDVQVRDRHTHRFLPPEFGARRATSHARRGGASACVPAGFSTAPVHCCQRPSGRAGPRVRPRRSPGPGAVQGEVSFRSQAAHADPVCGAAKSMRGVCGRSRARSER